MFSCDCGVQPVMKVMPLFLKTGASNCRSKTGFSQGSSPPSIGYGAGVMQKKKYFALQFFRYLKIAKQPPFLSANMAAIRFP
jgi:hypothetical protein